MSKVSVIMPIYNVEKYIKEAIESVLRQTYTDFELILINDRSTDHSREICVEYKKKDNRIVLLDNNSRLHGPGPTRNIGLDYATGEYIYFMDADDWIENRLLQYAVDRLQETGADIVQFGVIYERANDNSTEQYFWTGKGLLTKDEIKRDFCSYWKKNRNSLWLHMFQKEVVKLIRFENIIIGEDICYTLDALCNAEIIAYIEKALYHYRYVDGSTSHRWIKNTIECREIIWNHELNFLKSFREGMNKLAYAEIAYDNYIWAMYQLSSNYCPLSYRDKKRELFRLRKIMDFDKYRNLYPLKLQQGIQKLKYILVKCRLERMIVLFGPLFLGICRGE